MRNLRNIKHAAIAFPEEYAPINATTWDGEDLICVFGPSEFSPTITLRRLSKDVYSPDQATTIASWDAPSPDPRLQFDRVLNVHCSPDNGSIILVLEGGDIVVVNEDTQPGQNLIEIVGSVDAGIVAASWSPDEEILLIASKADTLLFMTREFEASTSTTLSSEDLKVSDHVSVGWGKRETQFQGRGAKALRDPTVPEHVDQGELSACDDFRTSISWRGDGQYVAVNNVLEAGEQKRRLIRFYSREGVLDSVSEAVDGLEGALSWKPSGQLISGIQRREERIDVVFFERNGLRHGEFSLRLRKEDLDTVGKTIHLSWNIDSSVLAVSMAGRVQLWTMGNYHYYLKQEIIFAEPTGNSVQSVWHTEKALQLACSVGPNLRVLSYTSQVTRGLLVPPYDAGTVAVIDGSRLKITPLKTANVPPPMAFDEFELPENVVDAAFSKRGTQLAVLHAESVSLWDCDYSSKPAKRATKRSQISLPISEYNIPRQVVLSANEEIVISYSGCNLPGTHVAKLSDLPDLPPEGLHEVLQLFPCTNHDRILYEDSSGSIFDLERSFPAQQIAKLPSPCPAVEVWREQETQIVFGLTMSGILHIHSALQTLKVQSCTSFIVTRSHLIYTTSQHLLKFVHLHAGELEVPPDAPEKDERCRNIERGAKLVTVMPGAYALVLQMPRGNLETIYPRALVLAGIRHAIAQRDYKKAFRICRTQRVDMNILHDYAPAQFIRDIALFIEQIRKVEYIDLFLSSLSDEDVSQTIYKETLTATAREDGIVGVTNDDIPQPIATASSKTNHVCNAFLAILVRDEKRHLQNIVTAHVCKRPPDLEAGLSLVANLRKSGQQAQLEQAVEHICFLADVNQLYETALGIYDLDVALLVAQQSQKDPREYLPYLQNLHDMSPLRQRHAIDHDLKRHQKALTHLHALGEFEAVQTYAIAHELYSSAIELYRYDHAHVVALMRVYADFLCGRNRYKDAGIAYEYVADYAAARDAFRACNMWRECLSCAGLMGMPDEQLSTLAHELAEGLEEAKDYVAAATVRLDYTGDLTAAVALLCRGYHFADAMRHVARARRPELLRELVDVRLVDASATMTEMLAEMKTQLQNQIPRLRELRQRKLEDPMGFLDGGGDGVGGGESADVPDNISLAPTDSTTAGTFMTRYTNRSTGTLATNATRKTSKNRRREERKRARGKKGTVYEEEYLVHSIARLIERLNASGEDVARLLEGLMRRAMRERALAVETAFRDVRQACRDCMAEVFSPSPSPAGHAAGSGEDFDAQAARPWGGEGVLWESLTASQQKREAPPLKEFERLSLLEK